MLKISRLPKEKRNALWLMFSAVADTVRFGASAYQWHRKDLCNTVMIDLVKKYKIEGVDISTDFQKNNFTTGECKVFLHRLFFNVQENLALLLSEKHYLKTYIPYTAEDYLRNARQRILNSITADEILRKFSTDELFKKLSADELLKRFTARERLSGLKPEEIKAYLNELKQKSR